MITPNATKLQQAQSAMAAGRDRQARYTAAAALKPAGLVDPSVILDSTLQRIYRMRKGILTSSRLITQRLENSTDAKGRKIAWCPVMVTMTYAAHINYEPEHITKFLRCVYMWGERAGYKIPYCWVMELTKKGKPHYHCILWIPKRLRLPRADSRGWWPHGMTNTIRARNAYGYLSKYASKAHGVKDDKGKFIDFPKGARIHGIGGLTKKEAAIIAWWKLPKALRLGDEGSHKWRRQKGGGWMCIEGGAKGQVYESVWGLVSINMVDKRVRLIEKPIVVHVDPPDYVRAINDKIIIERQENYQKLTRYVPNYIWQGGAIGFTEPKKTTEQDMIDMFDTTGLLQYGETPFKGFREAMLTLRPYVAEAFLTGQAGLEKDHSFYGRVTVLGQAWQPLPGVTNQAK